MRILYVVSGLVNYGGIESFCKTVIPHIDLQKYNIDFLINSPLVGEIEKKFTDMGCGIFHIQSTNFRSRVSERNNWFKVNAKNYDIIHIHTVLTTAFQTARIAKKCGAKHIIVHSHTDNNYEGAKLKNNICRFLLNYYTDTKIGCSSAANYFLFGKKGKNAIVLFNPTELSKFAFSEDTRSIIREDLGLKDKFVVGHVGRLTQAKNHKYLLNVFKEIKAIREDTKLLLVGDGELKESIVDMINELGLEKDVIMVGAKSDVYNYLNAMDCFIFPSLYEGFGIVLVEAQANGLPILASDAISKEVFLSDNIQALSNKLPPEVWAGKAVTLLRKEENKSLLQQCNAEVIANKLQSIYSNITE